MNIRKREFNRVQLFFKNSGYKKRDLHVYPDGLIRIRMKEAQRQVYNFLYIAEVRLGSNKHVGTAEYWYVVSQTANRYLAYGKLHENGVVTFDVILGVLEDNNMDELVTLLLFNLEKVR